MINRLSSELQSARQIIATLPHSRRTVESEAETTTDIEMHPGDEEASSGLPGIGEDLVKVSS